MNRIHRSYLMTKAKQQSELSTPTVKSRRQELIRRLVERPHDQICGALVDNNSWHLTDAAMRCFIDNPDFDPGHPRADDPNWEPRPSYCIQGLMADILMNEDPERWTMDDNLFSDTLTEDTAENELTSSALEQFDLGWLGFRMMATNDSVDTSPFGWSFAQFACMLLLFDMRPTTEERIRDCIGSDDFVNVKTKVSGIISDAPLVFGVIGAAIDTSWASIDSHASCYFGWSPNAYFVEMNALTVLRGPSFKNSSDTINRLKESNRAIQKRFDLLAGHAENAGLKDRVDEARRLV